jgi:HK97 family phage portal protein
MQLVKRAAASAWQIGAGLSLSDFDRVLDQLYGGQPSYTGKLVSQSNSLGVDTVWACVSVLSGDLATLPFLTYRYLDNGLSKEPARDHYLWGLLTEEANPELTAWRWKLLMQTWLLLWGNSYSEIEISGRGQVTGLWPWRPDRTTVTRAGGPFGPLEYWYTMRDGKKMGPVPADRMLHLRGLSMDGVMGLSPIEAHRQTVGMSMAILEHGGRTFGNGAVPLGVLQHPGKLSPKAGQSLESSWLNRHQGLDNTARIAILEEGMEYKEVGMKMVDAQYIQSAGLTNEAIARIFNMPQHKIGILTHATFSNIEHMSLDYVLGTIAPWAANWHQEIERSLLSARERQTITVRPNYRQRLRGDHTAMAAFISQLVDRGILSADEVREEFLDMNPQSGGVGRDYYKALNMAPVAEDNFGKSNTAVAKITKKPKPGEDDDAPPAKPAKPNGKPNGSAAEAKVLLTQ